MATITERGGAMRKSSWYIESGKSSLSDLARFGPAVILVGTLVLLLPMIVHAQADGSSVTNLPDKLGEPSVGEFCHVGRAYQG